MICSVRFDDTLGTVLAADLSTPFGVQSAWRQLVDLIGRRRIPLDAHALAVLRSIHARVPAEVRAASARGLAFANPPAALVRLFAREEIAISEPVLRTARLSQDEWIELLPVLSPQARAILRHRRDLSPAIRRALDSFGPQDRVLPGPAAVAVGAEAPTEEDPPFIAAPADPEPREDHSFLALVEAGAGVVHRFPRAEAVDSGPPVAKPVDDLATLLEGAGETLQVSSMREEAIAFSRIAEMADVRDAVDGAVRIEEVVARVDAYYRERIDPAGSAHRAEGFRFETDAEGVIRWVAGVSRAPIIGLSLDLQGHPEGSRVDGVASGAFRRRTNFTNARLRIEGTSDAAGDWLISGAPAFDAGSGRFAGYRGTARRPRADERAEASRSRAQLDSLRQLVHELRTPTNAIAGFAEMIEAEMLGPVAPGYRANASVIRDEARHLLGAIDDLDLAARIESNALALRPDSVPLRPLLTAIADDLASLMRLRGSWLALPINDLAVTGDRRAVERLLSRLLATLASASAENERIAIHLSLDRDRIVVIAFDRPRALADYPGDAVFGIDDEEGDATLLGTGFALRLARNLARELGGSLMFGPESLTLRLPAADAQEAEQVHYI